MVDERVISGLRRLVLGVLLLTVLVPVCASAQTDPRIVGSGTALLSDYTDVIRQPGTHFEDPPHDSYKLKGRATSLLGASPLRETRPYWVTLQSIFDPDHPEDVRGLGAVALSIRDAAGQLLPALAEFYDLTLEATRIPGGTLTLPGGDTGALFHVDVDSATAIVPEPSTTVMILSLLGVTLWRRRQRSGSVETGAS